MKKRKRYTWSFDRMHPVLQIISFALVAIATAGYTLGGIWVLYIIFNLR